MRISIALVLIWSCWVESIPLLRRHHDEWHAWKAHHSRHYFSVAEEQHRYEVWLDNKLYVDQHNSQADKLGYSLKLNAFGDKTYFEWWNITSCHSTSALSSSLHEPYKYKGSVQSLPTSVNWILDNAVTPVKNQEDNLCHSCYAFAATGALEGALAILKGNLVSLSEQQILDCSRVFSNAGCHGGSYRSAWSYISAAGGIESQESYPYHSYTSVCSFNEGQAVTTVKKVLTVQTGSETDLMAAVAEVGPVAVAIDHRHRSFQFYSYGVYSAEDCSNLSKDLSHEMLVVGYGTHSGRDFWLVKNSYGLYWGISGYMMLARNRGNMCGVATEAGLPIP
ncbi:hypothetical protein EMCRGX_G022039 [Ephydatia muelleri]|eukprot:Em0009g684a